jgi:integration host factor subunit alpha
MTKADIVDMIAGRTGFTKPVSFDLFESVMSIMKDTLADGETVKISGFGSFILKVKHDRRGRNPHTGEEIVIEARRILTFKPSLVLKDAMNGAGAVE